MLRRQWRLRRELGCRYDLIEAAGLEALLLSPFRDVLAQLVDQFLAHAALLHVVQGLGVKVVAVVVDGVVLDPGSAAEVPDGTVLTVDPHRR